MWIVASVTAAAVLIGSITLIPGFIAGGFLMEALLKKGRFHHAQSGGQEGSGGRDGKK